jgi:Flp pilus assembly pilin Flp
MGIVSVARLTAAWITARIGLRSERGAAAVEYGILASLIAALVVAVVAFLGNRTSETFSCAASNLGAGTQAAGC